MKKLERRVERTDLSLRTELCSDPSLEAKWEKSLRYLIEAAERADRPPSRRDMEKRYYLN